MLMLVVVVVVLTAILVAFAFMLRQLERDSALAAETPLELTYDEFLSQLRADAQFDSHHVLRSRWGNDIPRRFAASTARQILTQLHDVDANDHQLLEDLAQRYGAYERHDMMMMRWHPVRFAS